MERKRERERKEGSPKSKRERLGRSGVGACDESKWRRNGVREQECVNGFH